MKYEQIADWLGVKYPVPSPEWLPFSGRLPRIEIFVDGRSVMKMGGAHRCLYCGFGVDMIPSDTSHPKARPDGKCPNCANTGTSVQKMDKE